MANFYRADNIVGYFGEERASGAAASSYGTGLDTASSRVDGTDNAESNRVRTTYFSFTTPASGNANSDVYEVAILPQDAVVLGADIGSAGSASTNASGSHLFKFGAADIGSGLTGINTAGSRKGTGLDNSVTTTAFPVVSVTVSSHALTASTTITGGVHYYLPEE